MGYDKLNYHSHDRKQVYSPCVPIVIYPSSIVSPKPWQPLLWSPFLAIVLPFPEWHVSGFIQCVTFWVGLHSLSKVHVIHPCCCVCRFLRCVTQYCSSTALGSQCLLSQSPGKGPVVVSPLRWLCIKHSPHVFVLVYHLFIRLFTFLVILLFNSIVPLGFKGW